MLLNSKSHRLSLALITSVTLAGCGKDTKKDTPATNTDTATTTVTTSPSPAEVGKLSLMPAIDVSCGTENCFAKESASFNLQGESELQAMAQFSQLVVGFPQTVYDGFDDNMKEVMPKDGFVGKIEAIRESIVDSAVSYYSTTTPPITSCQDTPSSGTFPVDTTLEVTWTTPALTAPIGNKYTGTYDKAVTATIEDVDYRFEFMCDKPAMAVVALKKAASDIKVAYVFFYENDASANDLMKTEFALWAAAKSLMGNELSLHFLMQRDADKNLQAWVTRTGPGDTENTWLGYRYAINKAGSDDAISYFTLGIGDADQGSNSNISRSDWLANAHVVSDSVTGTASPTAINAGSPAQGCATDWNAAKDTLTSSDLCSGLDLTKAPKSGLQADSDGSMKWVDENLKTLLLAL